jgi:hypothetical protein
VWARGAGVWYAWVVRVVWDAGVCVCVCDGVLHFPPYCFSDNPWDLGTRRDAGGRDDATLLDTLIRTVGADGFNGDTMGTIPEEFYTESVKLGHPIALEPEGGGGAETISWDTLGWGYWQYPQVNIFVVCGWHWLWSSIHLLLCVF